MSAGGGDSTYDVQLHCYDFKHGKRGRAIIFNHMEYDPKTKIQKRLASICDANMLVETFKKLGFAEDDIHIYHGIHVQPGSESLIAKANGSEKDTSVAYEECQKAFQAVLKQKKILPENIRFYKGSKLTQLTSTESLKIIEEAAKDEKYNEDADCIVFAVLSHGGEVSDASDDPVRQGFIHCYEGPLHIELFMKPLRDDTCLSLKGKPKLFFIQACRGTGLDDGVLVQEDAHSGKVSAGPPRTITSTPVEMRNIPAFNNFLTAYSTPPGYFSFKGPHGSYFIISLCSKLNEHYSSGMDLIRILTRASNHMAKEFTSKTYSPTSGMGNPALHEKKQVPVIVSKLTKLVVFTAN
ncbi:caspase-3 isoform X2 [Lingula anatina]|uniref:Caspase-3 isoform X2 n=1 Tax=Lingula anatina TaxID=7574 RepID=A0A1S3J932_LINAN|nr:caspase-3 isoform X2 [Lingula anatina]|eukprot:XP_013406379.1 caspase-3 isoform X2 [Lingula anatina]